MSVSLVILAENKYRYIYYRLAEFRNVDFADPDMFVELWPLVWEVAPDEPGWERSGELNGTCLKLIADMWSYTRKAIWHSILDLTPFKPGRIWIRTFKNEEWVYAVECLAKYLQNVTTAIPDSHLRFFGGEGYTDGRTGNVIGNKIFDEGLFYGAGEYRANQFDPDIEVSEHDLLTVELEQIDGVVTGSLEDYVGALKVNIAFNPLRRLTVRIIDENTNAIPGAAVSVYEVDKIVMVAEGVDDDYDGAVDFDLESGKYWVKAFFSDRESEWVYADLLEDTTVTASIGLGTKYWFSALVVAMEDYPEWGVSRGDPISGVRVRLLKDADPFYDKTTDISGLTPSEEIVVGTYTLKAEKGDWKTHTETLGLTGDLTGYRIEFEHTPALYYGLNVYVVDDGVPSSPIEGASIDVRDGSSDSGYTDAFGRYATISLLAGHYSVTASYAGLTGVADVELDREGKEVQVTVPLSGLTHILIMTVMDSKSGEVIPMVKAEFYRAGELVTTRFTDSSGRVSAELPEGDYMVKLSADSYRSKERNFSLISDISFEETLDYISPPPSWAIPATILVSAGVAGTIIYTKREAIGTQMAALKRRITIG